VKPIRILKALFIVKIVTLVSLLFIIAAVSLFVLLFPKSKIESVINLHAENLLQRRIDIGFIQYSFRGVKLTDVSIIEPESGNSFISAESIEVTFALLPIFNGKLDLHELIIDGLNITIDYDDGVYNVSDLFTNSETESETSTDSTFKTTIPDFHLVNATINVKKVETALEALEGEYIIDTNIIVHDDNTIFFNNLKLVLPEKRGKISGQLLFTPTENDFNITGTTTLENVDIRWTYALSIPPVELPYTYINGKVENLNITSTFTEGTVVDTRGRLNNGVQAFVKKGYCKVLYEPTELILKDVNGRANSSTFILNYLNVLFDERVLFEATINDVNVVDVKAMIPPIENLPLEGNAKGNLSFDNRYFNGKLEVTNAGFLPTIKNVTTTVVLKNNTFSAEKFPATILDDNATVSIASLSSDFDDFAFNASFQTLSLKSDGEDQLPLGEFDIVVKGIITADTLNYDELTFNDSYFAYTFNKEGITIPRFKTGFQNGEVAGEGRIIPTQTNPRADVKLQFSRVQVQNLSPYISEIKDRFYGQLYGSANLTFFLEDDPAEKMNGSASLKIENGKLIDTGVQNGLGIILQPLQYKLKDLEFQEIIGNVSITQNEYAITSLMFNSPNIRMSVSGGIEKNYMANLTMTLLFNSVFIQDIPNFAYPQFQRYREGEWYVVPLQIQNKNIRENPQAEFIE
jgi:hypothetical protein